MHYTNRTFNHIFLDIFGMKPNIIEMETGNGIYLKHDILLIKKGGNTQSLLELIDLYSTSIMQTIDKITVKITSKNTMNYVVFRLDYSDSKKWHRFFRKTDGNFYNDRLVYLHLGKVNVKISIG